MLRALKLNFPDYALRIRKQGQKNVIFDIVRNKFIPLTPEEWVRQHALHHLLNRYGISRSLIAVEKEISYQNLRKRFDIMVFNSSGSPLCMIECKSPDILLSRETLLQAAVYNNQFNCPYYWLTNGMHHAWIKMGPVVEFLATEPPELKS